ncbi:MAG: phage tail protein [Oscillospiraceae bacterium]|nr:phage tail protein [Oscillospiraceae bacterium]
MLAGYNFVFTCGTFKAGFSKISGIGGKAEIEYLKEGGRDSCAYPLAGASYSAGKLTFEKGWGTFNPLYSGGFKVGMRLNQPCTIIIYGEEKRIARCFGFDKGVISSWECSTLDAGKSDLIIDTLVIEHTGLYEVAI